MNAPRQLPPGPVMIDIQGLALTDLDRERLTHPLVGGLILFSRNYESPEQLSALCAEVKALRSPQLLIAIDHEGGRVQRCRPGFTAIPAMGKLGALWDAAPGDAIAAAQDLGYVLAAELRARGVDFSFTPVLDLDYGRSTVIGSRSFHRQPEAVVQLAGALIQGLRQAGMGCCGKHFPGHGWVQADSHVAIPVDERDWDKLLADMEPFRRLALDAVMPAHVIYPVVDKKSAGFSNYWINYLRNNLKFDGVVFSDDLSMEGASVAGDVVARAQAAWSAGCDMLLVCNAPEAVGQLLERWQPALDPVRAARVQRLLPQKPASDWADLQADPVYQRGVAAAGRLA
ncbi:beta-N-acetylhexosaminidase [Azospira sp. I09]|uniref:beta-N-acetylhexosaminidase n=1 Tax=Azospira sp. I09 TaxID=1765049 RepID=UPI001260BC6B|nr:beta-N-acetylhexosaminidase [Azospira sp. I09]BBN87701.1 beta-hexosaminidase [Azospira sp. I09]